MQFALKPSKMDRLPWVFVFHIAPGSKPSLVTRIARTGLGTSLLSQLHAGGIFGKSSLGV